MLTHRNTPFITFFLIPAVLIILASCSFSRTDMLELASSQPDIRIISTDPNPDSFNSVELYETKMKTFYIENQGTSTLKIRKLYTSDSANKEFAIDATNTKSDLEPGENTHFELFYKPSREQTSHIDLLVESNDPDQGLYSLSISGTGIWHSGNPPMILVMRDSTALEPDSIGYDFGHVDVGNSETIDFTIINHSNADADLAVSSISFKSGDSTQFSRIAPNLPSNIPHDVPDNYMYFSVQFSPTTAQPVPTQAYAVEVEIISDDPDLASFCFWVHGTGIAEQNIRVLDGSNEIPNSNLATNTLDFGTVEWTRDRVTKTLTIENTGTATLNISAISVLDPETPNNFSFTGTVPMVIVPGGSEEIDIAFEPVSTTGSLYADIDIMSDDPDESPYEFRVVGQSVDTHIQDIHVVNESSGSDIPSRSLGHDFETVEIGTSATVTFRIENRGNDNLLINGIAFNGDDTNFRIGSPVTGTLPPGGSGSFDVTYAPGSAAAHSTFIEIENNDPDPIEQPYVIELCGMGKDSGAPDIQVWRGLIFLSNYGSYYFNDDDNAVEWPGSRSRTFTIRNTGDNDLYISGLLIVGGNAGDFTSDLETPVSVAPGASKSFTVSFNPGKPEEEEEMRSARLQITNNDADENPYKIDLYGWVEYDD